MTRKPFNRDEALGLLDKGYKNALLDYDLRGVDLRGVDLRDADLRNADMRDADLGDADLRGANLCDADLRGANLCIADMRGVDLRDADLRGANLDFSCWPLWCGGLHVRTDKRIAVQLAYHLCSLQCDDEEFIKMRNSILGFANQFHRVDECGELKPIERRG